MSKINNNPLLKGVTGMLGDVVVFRKQNGQTIMANRPKKSGKVTESQLEFRAKFKRGVNYAKGQMLDPIAKAAYEAKKSDKLTSAYAVAMKDFLTAPTVDQLDRAGYDGQVGDKILIQASDDFKVESVFVTIRSAANAIVEDGDAVLTPNGEWEYTATTANPGATTSRFQVQAKDKPGNLTVVEF